MMKKGDILENILVENMAAEGKCISRLEGRVIFIANIASAFTHCRVTKNNTL